MAAKSAKSELGSTPNRPAARQRPASSRSSASSASSRSSAHPPEHGTIAERAYFIHLEEGSSDELANWLRAERELTAA